MTLLYADTSALLRAYFTDEPEHERFREMLLEGPDRTVSSEIARTEMASGIMAAERSGRLPRWSELLATIDLDCLPGGPITLIGLRRDVILATAYRLVLDHRLRTLDAIHLAVAVEECPGLAAGDDVTFVTSDRGQAAAARALGLTVR